jgi:uncharacterized membrane protein
MFNPVQRRFAPKRTEEATAMNLLIILALAGAVSGSVSGAFWGGSDEIILGAVTGVILGSGIWLLTGSVMRVLHEYRLNRYFRHDSADEA